MILLGLKIREEIGEKLERNFLSICGDAARPHGIMFGASIFSIDGLASGVIDHATARALMATAAAVVEYRMKDYKVAEDLAIIALASFESVAAGIAAGDALDAEETEVQN